MAVNKKQAKKGLEKASKKGSMASNAGRANTYHNKNVMIGSRSGAINQGGRNVFLGYEKTFILEASKMSRSMFFRFSLMTVNVVKNPPKMADEFRYDKSYCIDEVKECYNEYHMIPGFEKEKEALRIFLSREDPSFE